MRRKISLLALTLFMLAFQPTFANGFSPVTGVILKEKCATALQVIEDKKAPQDAKELGANASDLAICLSYISAINDTILYVVTLSAAEPENVNAKIQMPYCLPDNIAAADKVKSVLKYLDENPAALTEHAPVIIQGAFAKSYPCGQ